MVGLFGGDLTAFLEDCAAAEDDCDVADYAGLSGWAIGIEWTPAQARLRQVFSDDTNFVIFADQFIGVSAVWGADSAAAGKKFDVEEITKALPAEGDYEAIFDIDALNFFDDFFSTTTDLDGPLLAYKFQDEEDEINYEVDSESTVWNYYNDADGVKTEVTWAGAAQLTAAAGAVAVALLF